MTVHFFNLFTTASYAKESPDSIFAKYAVLLDGDTGRVLYGKNENEKAPMASTTKIMTCIVALEYAKENILCTTSAYAASMPDVQLNAVKGEIFSINDLLYSLMLKSHNDTAVIIAENIALHYLYNGDDKDSMSPETNTDEQSRMLVLLFASAMNRKAAELGCHDTYFITPNGLDSEDENGIHSTTARDLATIMAYCIKNQDFLNITQSKNHTFTSSLKTSDNNLKTYNSYSVSNSNAFLDMYDNVISGKPVLQEMQATVMYVHTGVTDVHLLLHSWHAAGQTIKHINGKIHGNFWITQETRTIRQKSSPKTCSQTI